MVHYFEDRDLYSWDIFDTKGREKHSNQVTTRPAIFRRGIGCQSSINQLVINTLFGILLLQFRNFVF